MRRPPTPVMIEALVVHHVKEKQVRRIVVLAVVCLVLSGLTAQAAFADSPHFSEASATGPDSAGDLAVTYKLVGLGNAGTVTSTADATATATYACKKGKKFSKKTTVSGPVSASESATPVNGSVTESTTLKEPSSSLKCSKKKKQSKVLVSVSYENVSVSSAGAPKKSIEGTFTKTFYNI